MCKFLKIFFDVKRLIKKNKEEIEKLKDSLELLKEKSEEVLPIFRSLKDTVLAIKEVIKK